MCVAETMANSLGMGIDPTDWMVILQIYGLDWSISDGLDLRGFVSLSMDDN